MPEQRIVSLIASATEIVAALGFENQLVGRSHECDFPPAVRRLPACSQSKIDLHASSREIDGQVISIVRDGLSVYRVDPAMLNRLRPTVILTQTQCEVCAVSLKDVEAAVCELVDSQPAIVSLQPMTLGDVWQDIRKVGEALGATSQADAVIGRLKQRLDALSERTSPLNAKPTLACIEWIDPLMNAGNWVPELVEIAGGVNVFGEAGKHSGYMLLQELIDADPDVIAVMPCGFDIDRARAEMPALSSQPPWRELSAVKNGRVFLTDGNRYFNRPGPRLVESAEILAEILHPGVFNFGHRGSGWVPAEGPA